MTLSHILITHLRDVVPVDAILDVLCSVTGTSRRQFGTIGADAPIWFEHSIGTIGFRTTFELHVGLAPAAFPASDLALARILAAHLGQDVLIPPCIETSPHRWELVRPDGSTSFVMEAPRVDEAAGIVIDETAHVD